MEIIKVKLEDIKPYENNAKEHPQWQIDQIAKSIKEFGNNDPIAIDENNVIIEGHGRYYALKQLGYKEAECIRLNHLTDEQKKAYILVHNKLTMNSDFDFNILDAELAQITIDMSEFGFEKINLGDYGTEFELQSGDKGNLEQITFTLANEQAEVVREAISMVNNDEVETFGNENKNGNAIYEVCKQWVEQKK